MSSLFNQSNPSNGWVFWFSVMSIGSFSLFFLVLTSTIASPLNFIWFSFTSTKHILSFLSSFGIFFGRIIVIGDPVSMMKAFGSFNAVDGLRVIHFRPRFRVAACLVFFPNPVYGFGFTDPGEISRPFAVIALWLPCRTWKFGCPFMFAAKVAISVWKLFLSVSNGFRLHAGLVEATCSPVRGAARWDSSLFFCSFVFVSYLRL